MTGRTGRPKLLIALLVTLLTPPHGSYRGFPETRGEAYERREGRRDHRRHGRTTAAIGGCTYGWKALTRLRELRLERLARTHPVASRPPIEVEAARLRRMLQRREELLGSTSGATRTHLIALDSAIVDSASELADAVGVERPHRVPSVSLPRG